MSLHSTLAARLIDERIDEYIHQNRRRTKSSSEGMSVLKRCFQRYYKHHNKVVSGTIKEGWLDRDAA